MALWLPVLLLGGLFSRSSLQEDPLKDFCRIFGHSAAQIDQNVFISGGQLDWNPMSQNEQNQSSNLLFYNNLNISNAGMPEVFANISLKEPLMTASGGALWADNVNKLLYQWAGESRGHGQSTSPTLAIYDVVWNAWNKSIDEDESGIRRVAWGASVSIDDRAEGYYLGGWMSNKTVPGWAGPRTATSGLIRYDMASNSLTNNSGPDNRGRAEGVLVYLPASDAGLLIYFGGIIDPYQNGTMFGSPMSTIFIYDLASSRWYSQNATGEVPDQRRRFCAGATWADDRSSYNIYLYGGLGVPPNGEGFDDVYILTLPSFQWVKWWPTEPGTGRPHHSMTCSVINRTQMLIIGGTFPLDDDCDAPIVFGQHNLMLSGNGQQNAKWDIFHPSLSAYQVPQEIISRIGGSPSGGATVLQPPQWGDRDLPVYFSRIPTFPHRSPTRQIPGFTNSAKESGHLTRRGRIGVIVGCTFAGIMILSGLLFCLIPFRKPVLNNQHSRRSSRAELPGCRTPELQAATIDENEDKVQFDSDIAHPVYYNFESSTQSTSPINTPHEATPRYYLNTVDRHLEDSLEHNHFTLHPGLSTLSSSPAIPVEVYPLRQYYPAHNVRLTTASLHPQQQFHR